MGELRVYKVLQEYVELRSQPSLEEGSIVGQIEEGSLLRGTLHQAGEEPWLRLCAQVLPPPMGGVAADGALWTPVAIVMSFGNIDMLQLVEEEESRKQEREEEEERRRQEEEQWRRQEEERRWREEEEQHRRQEEERRRQAEEERRRQEEEERQRRQQEEEEERKKHEEKAQQAREAVRAAQELLAKPLAYELLRDNCAHLEPLPHSEQGASLQAGSNVAGYPAGAAWVKLESQGWLPVRSLERDLNLRSLWSELTVTKVQAGAVDLSWPGVQGKPTTSKEYVVEWRPHEEPPPQKSSGRATSSKESAKLSNMPLPADVQMRVSVRVARGGKELKLSGPWLDHFLEPPADLGEGLYEVINKFVMLRCEPSRKGRPCGTLKQGQQVYGTPFDIGDEPWLKLSAQAMPEGHDVGPDDSCWAMTDASGTDLGLGELLRRVRDGGPQGSKPGLWRVLHERVAVRSQASTEAAPLGFHTKDATVKGACVSAGGAQWLRTQFSIAAGVKEQEGWMLVDGSKLGLGMLLERIGDAEESRPAPRATRRPKPPRPLTAPWLAAHGKLPAPPSSVREELLPESEDVGMASQCSLVWVTGAAGEQCYVAKRAVEQGDLGSAWKEYRFYSEVSGGLQGGLRVPKCLVANWRQGEEREHFLLLMERLDRPAWVGWDEHEGITREQALCAVEALGRFHRAYEEKRLLEPLDWLGMSRFNLEHLDGLQHFYGVQLNLHRTVISKLLSPKAMEAAEALGISPSLNHVCMRLAEPPLTLCHGDYRPENLRFSAPGQPDAVAAFDWGLANISRGFDDFTYFVMLCQPPERRREHDQELLYRYLEARGWSTDEAGIAGASKDIKASALVILATILMTRLHTQNAGFYQGTRDMLTRMLSWTGQAIEDWGAEDVLPHCAP